MAGIHITDIERAINWWRERSPSADGISACAEVRALAEVYGLMVYYHEDECAEVGLPAAAAASAGSTWKLSGSNRSANETISSTVRS